MMMNPGSDRPQGPWDPDARPEFDVDNALTMMMLLVPALVMIGAFYFFGN
jgi:hypothetical protein